MKMKCRYFSLLIVIIAPFIFAQQRSAPLKPVESDGLHQIIVSPEIRSASSNHPEYLRILDAKNKEVPYVNFMRQNSVPSIKVYDIISKTAIPNVSSSFIILNKDRDKLSSIDLKIANTDIAKTYDISGSDDQSEWFGLVDNQIISGLSGENSTFIIRKFAFPLNRYKYLKFTFVDKKSLPVNVLSASLKNSSEVNAKALKIDNFIQTLVLNKERKQTLITIRFNSPQVIDGISFTVSSPKFFTRDVEISVPKTRTYKRKTETYLENLSYFQLSSKRANAFSFPQIFTKELIIIINNEDNEALVFDQINFFQDALILLADLKMNEKYSMIIDPILLQPQYDLAKSGIDFSAEFPVAEVGSLNKIGKNDLKTAEKPFWKTAAFMWICILIAIIAIGFFAVSMVKDLNRTDKI